MPIKSCQKLTIYITTALLIFCVQNNLCAQYLAGADLSSDQDYQEEENLTQMQKQAREYREQGLEFQRTGDLTSAMNFYQKAVEIDSSFPAAYNDLGVASEASGYADRAEESYLRAISIDPNYASPYSNLALLYEDRQDLNKALFYWEKRVEIGSENDPGTEKAIRHVQNICLVLGIPNRLEATDLAKEISIYRSLSKDNTGLAVLYFKKAKLKYKKGEDVAALRDAINALQLDSSNTEIRDFVEMIQTRLLSK